MKYSVILLLLSLSCTHLRKSKPNNDEVKTIIFTSSFSNDIIIIYQDKEAGKSRSYSLSTDHSIGFAKKLSFKFNRDKNQGIELNNEYKQISKDKDFKYLYVSKKDSNLKFEYTNEPRWFK